MDYYTSRYQDEENEQDYEDTISLSDFLFTSSEEQYLHEIEDQLCARQDLAEKTDNFEFSKDPNFIMSHAEDIINCGKLMPFKEQDHGSQNLYTRRRSESLPGLKISGCQSNSSNMKMRNSRSLDFQKLSRNSSTSSSDSPDSIQNRSISSTSSSTSSSSRFDGSNIKNPKPRWYILMFGTVRFNTEMDLQDIKSRQVYRTPSKPLFPGIEVVKKAPANRKRSWGVLEVLSCRGDASINVTASLACMPQVG